MALESAAQIMERLGFNNNADVSAKTAFLRHLIKDTYGVEVRTPLRIETSVSAHNSTEHVAAKQLSFDFDCNLQTG